MNAQTHGHYSPITQTIKIGCNECVEARSRVSRVNIEVSVLWALSAGFVVTYALAHAAGPEAGWPLMIFAAMLLVATVMWLVGGLTADLLRLVDRFGVISKKQRASGKPKKGRK